MKLWRLQRIIQVLKFTVIHEETIPQCAKRFKLSTGRIIEDIHRGIELLRHEFVDGSRGRPMFRFNGLRDMRTYKANMRVFIERLEKKYGVPGNEHQ